MTESWYNKQHIYKQCHNFINGKSNHLDEEFPCRFTDLNGKLVPISPLIAQDTFEARSVQSRDEAVSKCIEYHQAVRSALSELTSDVPNTKLQQAYRDFSLEVPEWGLDYDDNLYYCKIRSDTSN